MVVARGDERMLITKGAAERPLRRLHDACTSMARRAALRRQRGAAQAEDVYQKLSADGYRVLGVAIANVDEAGRPTRATDERDMTLVGFARLPRPAQGGRRRRRSRRSNDDGISVVIMTGDNEYVTQKIAARRRPAGGQHLRRHAGRRDGRCRARLPGRARRDLRARLARAEEPRHHSRSKRAGRWSGSWATGSTTRPRCTPPMSASRW